ncbi:MAG TPA: hypothetical protein VFA05_08735 [Gaiellaceae bacterium]|nr:hypothetical protein [Gaiellaceae bacterium]
MDWISFADQKRARYAAAYGDLDERGLVRRGNVAYAAGLALLMAYDGAAQDWLRCAAADWRSSWDAGAPPDAWGRPLGALKASLLAGDDEAAGELARWTLDLGAEAAESAIGRYAATLALLAAGRDDDARTLAARLRERDDFPEDVADALAAIAAADLAAYVEALCSVVASFETRDAFLEDVRVADTALVLHELARRRGLHAPLPASDVLP